MSATRTIELTTSPGGQASQLGRTDEVPAGQDVSVESSPAAVEEKGKTALIITTIAGVTTISSLLSGIVTIALPVMARDLDISPALLFWSVTSAVFLDVYADL